MMPDSENKKNLKNMADGTNHVVTLLMTVKGRVGKQETLQSLFKAKKKKKKTPSQTKNITSFTLSPLFLFILFNTALKP